MESELIVGLCRFSFLGRGDWIAYRGMKEVTPKFLDNIAQQLYSEERMKARFAAFEKICLPSVLTQTDPRFIFIVLSSPQMPEHWRNRLVELCKPHDQIALVWSDIPNTNDALHETLAELHDISDGQLWQFRLDDDDAIDIQFLKRLRQNISRVSSLKECGISVARGMFVAIYEGRETEFLEFSIPFNASAPCVKLSQSGSSIFKFGHFQIRNRLTNFVDFDSIGSLVLRWTSDSRVIDLDHLPPNIRRLKQSTYKEYIRESFPFLEQIDFDMFRSPSLAAEVPMLAVR